MDNWEDPMANGGFMDSVRQLIRDDPGRTAEHYAREGLRRGCTSRAHDPVFSFASSLAKAVRGNQLTGVRRERVDGEFRYFPVTPDNGVRPAGEEAVRVAVPVVGELREAVDQLVELDMFPGRAEAIVWLLEAGFAAKRDWFETKVRPAAEEIRRLKRSLAVGDADV